MLLTRQRHHNPLSFCFTMAEQKNEMLQQEEESKRSKGHNLKEVVSLFPLLLCFLSALFCHVLYWPNDQQLDCSQPQIAWCCFHRRLPRRRRRRSSSSVGRLLLPVIQNHTGSSTFSSRGLTIFQQEEGVVVDTSLHGDTKEVRGTVLISGCSSGPNLLLRQIL